MVPIVIRRATPADLEAAASLGAEIVRLHHTTNPRRFFSPDGIEGGYRWWLGKEIERPEAVVLVAERDGVIVGYAYGAIEDRNWNVLVDRHGLVQDVCVAEEARRQGIGRDLLAAVIAELERLGAPRVLCYVMVENEAAQALVRELDFQPTMVELTRERR